MARPMKLRWASLLNWQRGFDSNERPSGSPLFENRAIITTFITGIYLMGIKRVPLSWANILLILMLGGLVYLLIKADWLVVAGFMVILLVVFFEVVPKNQTGS